jgi:hypothetical protein
MSAEYERQNKTHPSTWAEVFSIIGPAFISLQKPDKIGSCLSSYMKQQKGWDRIWEHVNLTDADEDLIKLQFIALGYMKTISVELEKPGYHVELLQLTEQGTQSLLEISSVKAA